MLLTVPPTPENIARWAGLAPRAGRRPATVTLPGDPQRYIVRGVTLARDLAALDVDLVAYVPLVARAG